MTSKRVGTGWSQALQRLGVLAVLAMPVGAVAATAQPNAQTLPSVLPPMTVGIDSLDCSLRIDLLPQPGTTVHPDNRLQLTMSLPLQGALLRIASVTLGRVRSDSGEYLAVVTRPLIHDQHLTAESPANRERVLHIPCALSPPFQPCSQLLGLHGAMTLVMAHGTPAAAQLSARIGASVDCGSLGAVSIVERSAHGWQLRIPDALTDQLAEVVGLDAAGVELLSHTHAVAFADGGTATEVDCDLASCAALRIAWWPAITTAVIPIDIPAIAVPGGVTTIGELDLGAEPGPQAVPDASVLQNPLTIAVAHRDHAQIESLLAGGAAIDGEDVDGRSALTRAVAMRDPELVALLLRHHASVAPSALHPWSPLSVAIASGAMPMIRQLLAGGADPMARASDGRSAIDVAMELERWRALSLMLGNPEPK